MLECRGEWQRPRLWHALLESCRRTVGAVVVDPTEYRAAGEFYRLAGVSTLDEVLILRTSTLPGPSVVADGLEVAPVPRSGLQSVLAVDHSAFPWLWRNSITELRQYHSAPGVGLWAGLVGDQLVGYIGVTDFTGWGHVDRVAVRSESQGHGYGAHLLSWAMHRLHEGGARYVQLSTQGTNEVSKRLYQRFGFRQTRGAYKIYGLSLQSAGTILPA